VEAPKLAAGQGPPALNVVIIVTSLLFAVGAVLLGLATMRAGVLPRLAGLFILVSGVVVAISAAPLPSVTSTIINNSGTVLFFIGLIWIGYALLAAKGTTVTQPNPAL
jgi:hypothetical protein